MLGTQAGPRTSDKDWRALKGSHADCLPSARFTVVYPREQLADHNNAALLWGVKSRRMASTFLVCNAQAMYAVRSRARPHLHAHVPCSALLTTHEPLGSMMSLL